MSDKLLIDDFLASYGRFGVNLGLDRIRHLLARLGNPQNQVPIVHVAGTNGKGSVCAYVASVLSAAGYRVGRYTSPHLVNWNERICIGPTPITDEDLWQHLTAVAAAIDGETPTQFEVFTAAAWSYFAAQAVDIAVIEVGLGGRLDATNVCSDPLVTAIVSLSREHWQRLGPTVADIAREKAGIIKAQRPVVIGPLPPEADPVVRQRVAELGCELYEVTPARVTEGGTWCSGLAGSELISYRSGLLG
ncbi:MAG: Mur ligase family protein, partial [Cyanobacteria bacterium P01_F01_bin.116]